MIDPFDPFGLGPRYREAIERVNRMTERDVLLTQSEDGHHKFVDAPEAPELKVTLKWANPPAGIQLYRPFKADIARADMIAAIDRAIEWASSANGVAEVTIKIERKLAEPLQLTKDQAQK